VPNRLRDTKFLPRSLARAIVVDSSWANVVGVRLDALLWAPEVNFGAV
jgi:hypothetical protein